MEANETTTIANTNTNATLIAATSPTGSCASDGTLPPKDSPPTNGLKKRVHFSTQNSMVQVPRSDCSSAFDLASLVTSTTASHSTIVPAKDQLNYASIYSNEYEPIGSEHNSSNLYVDMESKLGQDDRPVMMEKIKSPPALPPKPANLMKLRQALKQSNAFVKPASVINDNESEPDYCSISEVQDAVMKNVQIVADVHKNADDDLSSLASDELKTENSDETFADVPKLPNVAAIISPKKEPLGKYITQDNYIKTSPIKSTVATGKPISNILSEINGKKATPSLSKLLVSPKMSTIVEAVKSPTNEHIISKKSDDKMMQAEFDWYNLDAEYGKLSSGDDLAHILHPKLSESDEKAMNQPMGIEYNLDEEFGSSLPSSESSLDENQSSMASSPPTTMTTAALAKTTKLKPTTISFVPLMAGDVCDEDGGKPFHLLNHKNQQLNGGKAMNGSSMGHKKTFDAFLDDTGLTAKPLPQKRKIYYTAPFV